MDSTENRDERPNVSPFRQDPLSRLNVRIHVALAIAEERGAYGLYWQEDIARILMLALGDVDELKAARGEQPIVGGLDWNEHADLIAVNE
jgi:hypothetical protein